MNHKAIAVVVGLVLGAGANAAEQVISSPTRFTGPVTIEGPLTASAGLTTVAAAAPPTTPAKVGLFVATTGNDANSCTEQQPCATVGRAAALAKRGDTVWIEPGEYVQEVVITQAGIAFRSVEPLRAVFVPPATSSSHDAWVLRQGADDDLVEGIVIDGAAGPHGNPATWGIGLFSDASNTVFRKNTVRNLAHDGGKVGIEIQGYYGNTGGSIESNIVGNIGVSRSANLNHCIYVSAFGSSVINNIVFGCAEGYGIHLWHGASHNLIANNLIFYSQKGILIGSGELLDGRHYTGCNDYTVVINNILVDADHRFQPTDAWGVQESSGKNDGCIGPHNVYSNNLVAVAGGWKLQVSKHENDIPGTPSFRDYRRDGTGDYRLADGSWGIDQGIAIADGVTAPSYDRDGTARPIGIIDIGPYERGKLATPRSQTWGVHHRSWRLGVVDQTATNIAGSYASIAGYGAIARSTGKYYWEIKAHYIAEQSGYTGVGIGTETATTETCGSDTKSVCYYGSDGGVRYNGQTVLRLPAWPSESIIAMALDLDHCKMFWKIGASGRWNNDAGADPATNTGGYPLTPTMCGSNISPGYNTYRVGDAVEGRFARGKWTGTLPDGFAPWQ